MIDFIYPDDMKNDQIERLLTAIEEALCGNDYGQFVPEAMQEAINDHGTKPVYEMIGSYLVSWCKICAQDEPFFSEEYYKKRARKHLLAVNVEDALEELGSYQQNSRRHLGKVVARCMECGRIRHGLEWKDEPTPDGWYEIETTCPSCDEWLSKERPARPGPTEEDLKAWLSEDEPALSTEE